MALKPFSSQRLSTRRFNPLNATPRVLNEPYFPYTTLLLSGNGTDGQNNHSFLDSSGNGFHPSRSGNTSQGTFSPFSQTGWGNYFDGSGDYLSVPTTTALSFGTGDFTIEAWIYRTGNNGGEDWTIIDGRASNSATPWVFGMTSARVPYFYDGVSQRNSSVTVDPFAWTHIAVTRLSGTLKIFVNGVEGYSAANSTNLDRTAGAVVGTSVGLTSGLAVGYISNLRVLKGTGYSTITVPTAPLTAISGTSLLTCQSNRFIDNSTNNFTITRNGDTRVVAFSPFNPTASWSAATNGGSGYFDGSGDYLTAGAASNWTFLHNGSDWTAQFWVYHDATSSYSIISTTAFSAQIGMSIILNNSGANTVQVYITRGVSGSDANFVSSAALVVNQWNYVAVTFTSSTKTCAFTINGASAGSSSNTGFAYSSSDPTNTLAIGRYQGSSPGAYLNGYISSLRISNTIRTGLTTLPTTPYTSDANTNLLLNFTNAGIYDATAKNVLETVGTAQASTTQAKFGTTSMYFDGATTPEDLLSTPVLPYSRIGAGDYTLEMWIRPSRVNTLQALLTYGSTAFRIFLNNSNIWFLNSSTTIVQYNSVVTTANQWYYLVLVRKGSSGTNCAIFLDGTRLGTGFTNTFDFNTGTPNIGGEGASNLYQGYMQDFRLTRFARYDPANSTITVPTAAFPTL